MRALPQPRPRDTICFGLLLGAALGICVLGLLMVGYAGLAMPMAMHRSQAGPMRDRLGFFAESVIGLMLAFLIGYAVMIAAWPWVALAPLNPIRGLIDFGQFNYQIHTLLDGQVYEMGNVPRWYVPVYLLIKLPLVMLVGAAAALLRIARPTPLAPRRRGGTALLGFIATFPIICEVVDRGPAFTGLLHFLFVVPPFAVLAGVGIDWLIAELAARRRVFAGAALAAIVAAMARNAGTLMQLHPYQYLFYNPLVGGLQGASGEYVTDYWVNIMPEVVDDLEAYIDPLDRPAASGQRYSVALCGERLAFEKQADARLRWTEDWKTADFFIAPTHMNCDRARNGW